MPQHQALLKRLVVALATLLLSANAFAATFYVDAESGSDSAKGLTEQQAWKSLTKVNDQKFLPGDRVLFHSGQHWTGTLEPHGSGTAEAPILITSYAEGPRPLIQGEGASETISLNELNFVTLRNLAVTNHGKTVGIRNGIMVHVSYAGLSQGIHLENLAVTDVNGEVGSKSSGGIGILAWGKNGKAARFDDLLIKDCNVEHVDGQGIWFHVKNGGESDDDVVDGRYPNTNIRITGTTITDTGRNAIFLRDGLNASIDHNIVSHASARTHGNAICIVGSKGTIIRNNEVSFTGVGQGGGENGAFDADDGARDTIIEYNWTHNNSGGMANIVNDPRKHIENSGTIVRFNLSENDKARIVSIGGAVQNSLIYNNTIFIGKGDTPKLVTAGRFVSHVPGDPEGIVFVNNVIYAQETASNSFSATKVAFDSNCFFGKHPGSGGPKDLHHEVSDYTFNNATMPTTTWKDIANYRIPPNSACAKPGLAVTNNGGHDILGTSLTTNSIRGAVAPLLK